MNNLNAYKKRIEKLFKNVAEKHFAESDIYFLFLKESFRLTS